MMAVPVMTLFISPIVAAAIMLPILLVMDWVTMWRYRHEWESYILKLLIPAAFIGIGIGAASFSLVSPELLRLGLGILSLAFVVQRALSIINGDVPSAKPSGLITWVLGATGGFTSFVAHAGAPPIKMLLLSHDLPKKKFVGTNSYLFGSINLLKCIPYFFLGQFSAENLTLSAWLMPFVLVGIPMGFWLNNIVSLLLFNRIIYSALTLIGLKLIWDGLAYFQ